MKALAKNPDDRFSTAEELIDALHNIAPGGEVKQTNRIRKTSDYPPPPSEQATSGINWKSLATAFLGVALVAGVGFALSQYYGKKPATTPPAIPAPASSPTATSTTTASPAGSTAAPASSATSAASSATAPAASATTTVPASVTALETERLKSQVKDLEARLKAQQAQQTATSKATAKPAQTAATASATVADPTYGGATDGGADDVPSAAYKSLPPVLKKQFSENAPSLKKVLICERWLKRHRRYNYAVQTYLVETLSTFDVQRALYYSDNILAHDVMDRTQLKWLSELLGPNQTMGSLIMTLDKFKPYKFVCAASFIESGNHFALYGKKDLAKNCFQIVASAPDAELFTYVQLAKEHLKRLR